MKKKETLEEYLKNQELIKELYEVWCCVEYGNMEDDEAYGLMIEILKKLDPDLVDRYENMRYWVSENKVNDIAKRYRLSERVYKEEENGK